MSAINNPKNLQVDINSMVGRLSLKQTESALSTSIRNLSSGIRVQSGRDDPAAFVAGSAMRTDIVSMSQAVSNCQRVNSVLSTVDSTLSHVNSLLLELRGLVTQAASSGGESAETIATMQNQVNEILNTINYLSGSTQFQGQPLIDGSLDFTTYGVDSSKISLMTINQANFQGRTEKDVSVQVLETPKQAELYYPLGALKNDTLFSIGGTGGYQTFNFAKEATVNDIADAVNRVSDATGVAATVYSKATPGTLGLTSYGKDNDIILTASQPGTEAGNFVVRYTAPESGNDTLSLSVSEGSGNEPTVIDVMLQTELWRKAGYHYNGDEDGVSNNEFTIAARYAGKQFNDIEFEFNNVYGTAETTGIALDMKSSPKKFVVNMSYNEDDPADPTNTSVNDLAAWIAADPVASTYFELKNTPPSDGTGPLIPSSGVEQTVRGVDGGSVLSTAEQVAELINTSPLLKDADGNGRLSAALPTGSTGLGAVSPFAEVSYYGDPSTSNYLQFLAPEGSPSIKFSSTPGTPLSVDDTTYPPVYGNATAKVQGLDAGTSFTLKVLSPGREGDGIGVIFRDSSEESAVFDAERNAVVFSVDFTGRAGDPNRGDFSMNDLKQMVADDPFLSSRFAVVPMTTYDPNDPPTFRSDGYLGIDAKMGETSGGLVSEGSIVIHLETDTNGIVKTTANDLVKFFNDPSTEESKEILDRLGISVSNIDPSNTNLAVCTTGQSMNGTGVLAPTYDPVTPGCPEFDGQFPDIVFSSYGAGILEENPSATITSRNGIDSDFTITAKQLGAAYNNTSVRLVSDITGPTASYNPITKELRIGVSPLTPSTANEIIDLINADPELSELFVASRGAHSTGEGTVAIGDRTVLTGGVRQIDHRAEGTVVSGNGLNAMFQVSALKTDAQYADTEINIVADSNGPTVSYDAQSKQLTIGVDPNNPSTAREIVDLINSTPDVMNLFQASIPAMAEGTSLVPNGEDPVRIGDSGTLSVRSTGLSLGAGMLGNSDDESLGIVFHSVEYGSQEFVEVLAANDSDFKLTDRFGNVAEKSYGTDVVAKIDGQLAIGNGRIASTATSDLDLSIWLDPNVQKGDVFGFRISGGGALVQLGADAVSDQQARLGITSIHTTSLGGISGTLSQLRTGEAFDLSTDTKTAFKIVEEVIAEVTSLRGRLGAFQSSRLEKNMDNLLDAIEIETDARSRIIDTDFAVESSNMARQQVLMQSTIAVLQQSSQSAQLLLSLLQR